MILLLLKWPLSAFQKVSPIENGFLAFWLLAQRRLSYNFLQSSRIQVHPSPATSTMPPKFKPQEIKVVYLKFARGEVGTTSALAPEISCLGLSPKKIGDDIAKAPVTGKVWGLQQSWPSRPDRPRWGGALCLVIRDLKEPPRDRNRWRWNTVEIPVLMRSSTLPSRCSTCL